MPHDPLLSLADVAELTGLSRRTVETYVTRGKRGRMQTPLPPVETCPCCGLKGYRRSAVAEWQKTRARPGRPKEQDGRRW